MPTLPLPIVANPGLTPAPGMATGVGVGAGDLSVASVDDVHAAWPRDIREAEDAPVRDDIEETVLAILRAHELAAEQAAAQNDILRAEGPFLDTEGEERGIYRQAGELDPSYRSRILAFRSAVAPSVICALANAILAPYTADFVSYSEDNDRWFVHDLGETSLWESFVWDRDTRNVVPNYPDRLYSAIFNRGPRGAEVNPDALGRFFVLRVPDLTGETNEYGIYNQIANSVSKLLGHSIRWVLLVDAYL